jgi:hypothetical protein
MTRSTARLVVTVSLGILIAGCAAGLPQRRPGSDITLPDSPTRRAIQALATSCDRDKESPSGTPRAKDAVDCGGANTDTVAVNDPQRTSTSPKTP